MMLLPICLSSTLIAEQLDAFVSRLIGIQLDWLILAFSSYDDYSIGTV